MALQFGTSGVRGLVTEMTDLECYLYTEAFVRYVKTRVSPDRVALAGDYRSSTPRIKKAVAFALRKSGLTVDDCGAVPTPALAFHGVRNRVPSIMVTGSHVPDDRNGIKFYMPWGEVLKSDEAEISSVYREAKGRLAHGSDNALSYFTREGELQADFQTAADAENPEARQAYIGRYLSFFPPGCLKGSRIVLWQHSSAAREVLLELMEALGARVEAVGWSERFIPVDTEAVENTDQLSAWVRQAGASALISADGDGDRPLLVDERGKVVRGDVLGILVADFLGADSVSAPVSCNTALERSGRFEHVARTRIGSPYVIESMQQALQAGWRKVVGYEANGGFLTASEFDAPSANGRLAALPTRDAALPVLAALARSAAGGRPVSAWVSDLPSRYTQSGLLRDFPSEKGREIVSLFRERDHRAADELFGRAFGPVRQLDFTDGVRLTFAGGDIVHLRPSGNAPEFRCYTEASTEERAAGMNRIALEIVRERFLPS
ncbi:MAG: phosphomannomutase [bacterium]